MKRPLHLNLNNFSSNKVKKHEIPSFDADDSVTQVLRIQLLELF